MTRLDSFKVFGKGLIRYSGGLKPELGKPNAIQNQNVFVQILCCSGLNTHIQNQNVKMAAQLSHFIFTKKIIYVKWPSLVL